MKHIGNTLSQIIFEKNLKQKDIAEKAGITPVYFNKILKKQDIDCSMLEKICIAMKISPSIMFDCASDGHSIVGNGNIQAINSTIELDAKKHEIELLNKTIEDKERTIQILMGKIGTKSGQVSE